MGKSDLELLIGDNESIVWRGKPDFKCFVLKLKKEMGSDTYDSKTV